MNQQRQSTLQHVARKVEMAVRVDHELRDGGFDYDARVLAHCRELVAVMRWLERMQVLIRADGDERSYVGGEGDCLYRIDRSALAMTLCSVRGASTVKVDSVTGLIDKLNEVDTPETAEAQNRELQHWLVRRLLDDPVVYLDEMSAREYEYFVGQGDRLLRELADATGMVVERCAEGVALLDCTGGWTDIGLPETGTRGHATLLVAEWLGNRLRDNCDPDCQVSLDELIKHVTDLAGQYAKYWREESGTPDGIRRITHDAIDNLNSLGLLEYGDDSWSSAL